MKAAGTFIPAFLFVLRSMRGPQLTADVGRVAGQAQIGKQQAKAAPLGARNVMAPRWRRPGSRCLSINRLNGRVRPWPVDVEAEMGSVRRRRAGWRRLRCVDPQFPPLADKIDLALQIGAETLGDQRAVEGHGRRPRRSTG